MNREALLETLRTGRGVYWSRSRGKLWRKGEESGHLQQVVSVHLDCDKDAVLLKIRQAGGAACHTGRRSCFHNRVTESGLKVEGAPLFDPSKVYKKK
jgi:phosphoribosyl-AMP cyclohydrolase